MFGRKKTHAAITIEFYQQGSTTPLHVGILPVDQVPDTFEIETTLSIGGEDWRIVEGVPKTKAEFRQTGRLRIQVTKPVTQYLDPNAVILYSLPTISADLAELEDRESLENVLVVHEDDWRQQEFLAQGYSESVEREMAAIRNIYATQQAGPGFRDIHIRAAISAPLDGVSLSLREVQAKLGAAHLYSGVAYSHTHAVIQRGFAFRTASGLILWGQLREQDELAFLCLRNLSDNVPAWHLLQTFDVWMADRGLLFVDWVQTIAGRKLSEVLLQDQS